MDLERVRRWRGLISRRIRWWTSWIGASVVRGIYGVSGIWRSDGKAKQNRKGFDRISFLFLSHFTQVSKKGNGFIRKNRLSKAKEEIGFGREGEVTKTPRR